MPAGPDAGARSPRGSLTRYHAKRDFKRTAEPRGRKAAAGGMGYLIQKHDARRLHYDFRLELDGVLKSWAVTRGPSLDPADKRLAVHVEDHPLDYGRFEGTIPKPQYGGGTVMLWDTGTWQPLGDPRAMYREGRLKFLVHGKKLHGQWALVRMKGRAGEKRENWLLIKDRDEFARPGDGERILDEGLSVKTGRTLDQIAANAKPVTAKSAPPTPIATRSTPKPRGRSPLPPFVAPQLATRVDAPPVGEEWVHEIKFDGYRMIVRLEAGKVKILTRSGLDWTARFPAIAAAVATLPARAAMIDGEIVALDARGHSDFAALQARLAEGHDDGLVLMAFDCLHRDGADLRGKTLIERKEALRALLPGEGGLVRWTDHIDGSGAEIFRRACAMALEGLVSKRIDSRYVSGRTLGWLKSKCRERQELIICGFTQPRNGTRGIGALVLGFRRDGELVHAGRVGTGFSQKQSRAMRDRLDAMVTAKSPFARMPVAARRGVTFVTPKLVCEVEFATWTHEGLVRQASFIALRDDKPAGAIGKEVPVPVAKAKAAPPATRARAGNSSDEIAGVRLTHPDRVLYPGQGITKRMLAEYYVTNAGRILPFVARRPLSIVRCPDGSGAACFYQKHLSAGMPAAIKPLPLTEAGKATEYVSVSDASGLVALAQFGVLEIHPWNCPPDNVEVAEQLVMDLDPDPAVPWAKLAAAARELKARLTKLGLVSFLKTTGGKGLHVVIPLRPAVDWAVAKTFTHALAQAMVNEAPGTYIATMSKAARKGLIFVDYLRNQRGATAIAPYSTRARQGAPVATPIAWTELNDRKMPVFGMKDIAKRPKSVWADFFKQRQTIDERVAAKLAGHS